MNPTQQRLAKESDMTITGLFQENVKVPASCSAKTMRVVAQRIKTFPTRSTFRIASHGLNFCP